MRHEIFILSAGGNFPVQCLSFEQSLRTWMEFAVEFLKVPRVPFPAPRCLINIGVLLWDRMNVKYVTLWLSTTAISVHIVVVEALLLVPCQPTFALLSHQPTHVHVPEISTVHKIRCIRIEIFIWMLFICTNISALATNTSKLQENYYGYVCLWFPWFTSKFASLWFIIYKFGTSLEIASDKTSFKSGREMGRSQAGEIDWTNFQLCHCYSF